MSLKLSPVSKEARIRREWKETHQMNKIKVEQTLKSKNF